MMRSMGDAISFAARRAGLVLALTALALAGAGFLAAAGWTALEAEFGPVAASAVTGAALLAPPVVCVLVLALRPRQQARSAASEAALRDNVALAFTLGAEVGARLARTRRGCGV